MVNETETKGKAKVVTIVGGGPAGLLAAHRLVKRQGYEVHVYDKRSDLRKENPSTLRSYPIGLQERGLEAADPALRRALEDAGTQITGVALQGGSSPRRMPREPSLYLDRNLIVWVMLKHITSEAEMKERGDGSSLHLHFEHTIERLDLDAKVLYVRHNPSNEMPRSPARDGSSQGTLLQQKFDGLIAADGANSIVRRWLQALGEINVEEEEIPNHYRTFSIPLLSHDATQILDPDRVHGWMLGDKTCLMVPNRWGFASGVFIYPREKDPFEDMDVDSPEEVQAYFEKISPKPYGLSKFIGKDEALDMISRPYNYASTARVDRLHARDCVLFLGDSAHAVSASVGQACNAALQDVAKFDEVLTETSDHWHRSLLKFTERRLKDILALHELSDYSLPNPKDKWIQTEFIFRAISKKVLPTFISKHMSPMPNELLSTTNMSYSEILEQTEWWTQKVKRSMRATNGYESSGSSSSGGSSGGGGGLKRSPKSGNISLLDTSKRKMVRVR